MGKISVVINTLNEEDNLPGALNSVKKLADEIVVVDMHSDDDTRKIAKKAGAKVYKHKKMGYVEPARNYAIEKASGEWIFILDADERVPGTLVKELKKIAQKNEVNYVAIPRKNIVFGKWLKHSRWWPDYNVRFFKKGKVKWDDKIHSIPQTIGEGKDLKVKKEFAIIHNNYTSLTQFIRRMDRYTGIQSKEIVNSGYSFNWKDLIKKPASEFLSRYFKARGYKDGVHGLTVALLQAFSEALVYMKIWELKGSKKGNIDMKEIEKEILLAKRDMNYWISDSLLKESGKLVYKVKRKLKI